MFYTLNKIRIIFVTEWLPCSIETRRIFTRNIWCHSWSSHILLKGGLDEYDQGISNQPETCEIFYNWRLAGNWYMLSLINSWIWLWGISWDPAVNTTTRCTNYYQKRSADSIQDDSRLVHVGRHDTASRQAAPDSTVYVLEYPTATEPG